MAFYVGIEPFKGHVQARIPQKKLETQLFHSEGKVKELFQKYDVNKDGCISEEAG